MSEKLMSNVRKTNPFESLYMVGKWPDVEICQELGLQPKKVGNSWEEIGIVKINRRKVRIEASCFPAHFWRFTFQQEDSNERYVVSTGSGGLSDYWPAVKLMVEGMLVVKIGQNKESRT